MEIIYCIGFICFVLGTADIENYFTLFFFKWVMREILYSYIILKHHMETLFLDLWHISNISVW